MKTSKKIEGRLRGMPAAVAGAVLCAALFSGCAYTQADVRDMWQQVAKEYPNCKAMPAIMTLDNGTMGGFYERNRHIVVIDKYASEEVWMHEFRHACGDSLGEKGIAMEGVTVEAFVQNCWQREDCDERLRKNGRGPRGM